MYFCGNHTLAAHSLLLREGTFCLVRRSFPLLVSVCSLVPHYVEELKNACFPSCRLSIGAFKKSKIKLLPIAPSALLYPQLMEPVESGFGSTRAERSHIKAAAPPHGKGPPHVEVTSKKALILHVTSALTPVDSCRGGKDSLGNSYFCIANRSKLQPASACTSEA